MIHSKVNSICILQTIDITQEGCILSNHTVVDLQKQTCHYIEFIYKPVFYHGGLHCRLVRTWAALLLSDLPISAHYLLPSPILYLYLPISPPSFLPPSLFLHSPLPLSRSASLASLCGRGITPPSYPSRLSRLRRQQLSGCWTC